MIPTLIVIGMILLCVLIPINHTDAEPLYYHNDNFSKREENVTGLDDMSSSDFHQVEAYKHKLSRGDR